MENASSGSPFAGPMPRENSIHFRLNRNGLRGLTFLRVPHLFPVPGISSSHFRNERRNMIIPLTQLAVLRSLSFPRNFGHEHLPTPKKLKLASWWGIGGQKWTPLKGGRSCLPDWACCFSQVREFSLPGGICFPILRLTNGCERMAFPA